MKVEYSNRAVADLHKISTETRLVFGDRVAEALDPRIRAVIRRISIAPLSAPQVKGRPDMRVVPLLRYPFKIFYRVLDDRIRIQHIRHTARRPWQGREWELGSCFAELESTLPHCQGSRLAPLPVDGWRYVCQQPMKSFIFWAPEPMGAQPRRGSRHTKIAAFILVASNLAPSPGL
jgi:plasmid stabilization system protein ParE